MTIFLEESILATFGNLSTVYSSGHSLFYPDFAVDESRLRQWKAFLTRNHLDKNLDFPKVIGKISSVLIPIWERMSPS
jgi:hypothetical protein